MKLNDIRKPINEDYTPETDLKTKFDGERKFRLTLDHLLKLYKSRKRTRDDQKARLKILPQIYNQPEEEERF